MIFGKKIQVGLDIGKHSLQWGAIDLRSRKTEVWRAQLYHPDATPDTTSLGSGRIKALLQELEAKSKMWSKNVVLGMQGAQVISGYLEFPPLRSSEIEMAVTSSVSREIPFPIQDMEVVHLEVEALNPGKTAVFYSVWPRIEQMKRVEICESCDLKVKRIEATGIGLTRELYRNRPLDPKKFYGIINIGHDMTQVLVVRGGYPYYLRDIPVGGQDFTKSIALRKRLSTAEAEAKKMEEPLFELFSSLGAVLSELTYEIARTFKYFKRRFKVSTLGEVYLSGGGASIKDYAEWLDQELEVSVVPESWEDFSPRELDGDAMGNKVALGLALG